jgi:hypothetical protein
MILQETAKRRRAGPAAGRSSRAGALGFNSLATQIRGAAVHNARRPRLFSPAAMPRCLANGRRHRGQASVTLILILLE